MRVPLQGQLGVGVPPSVSVAVAAQVRVSPTWPVRGETLTEVITGPELVTVAVAEPVSVPPSASVAETLQVRVSPTESRELMVYVERVEPSCQS